MTTFWLSKAKKLPLIGSAINSQLGKSAIA